MSGAPRFCALGYLGRTLPEVIARLFTLFAFAAPNHGRSRYTIT